MLVNVALVASYVIGIALVVRSVHEGHFRHYSFFESYFLYYLGTGVVGWGVLLRFPAIYPHYFWIRFLTLVIAEFAVVVEIGDYVFRSRPALRAAGRFVTIGVAGFFLAVYALPPLLESRPSDVAIYDLVLRSAMVKVLIALMLVAIARRFHVALGRNIAGILTGLIAFLCISIANFSLIEHLGRKAYGAAFMTIGPLSQTLMLLIWLVSLWKYEPAPAAPDADQLLEAAPQRLAQYDTSLQRLLRR